MPTLETALRLIVIGQEFLIATIFLSGGGSRVARISGSLLLLSVAGYLLNSDPDLRNLLPSLLPVVILLAMIVPYCLWSFARAVFEAPWPRPWIMACFVTVGVLVWTVFVARDYFGPVRVNAADILMHVVALVLVFHALWLTARGRPDDLIERRRSFRLWFFIIVAAEVAAVLVVELVIGTAAPPEWLTLLNVLVIAGLTFGLAIPMLRLNPVFFPSDAVQSTPNPVREDSMRGASDIVLRKKLIAAMDAGAYRETGLTIRSLAGQLDYPEHQLRRLINGHMGFRNFSAFLNSYRISEARNRFADPERARTPVLTIALDLGYASLGPFNRAFKETTGVTPTEYRRTALRQDSADSE